MINQVIKLCFIAKSVLKNTNIMVFFVTIQDSVDELRINFLISIIFFLDMTTWNYSTRKNVLLTEIWLDYSQFMGLYINEEKKHLIWYHLAEISTRRCKYNFLENRQKLFPCLQLLIDLLMYMYIIHDSVLVSCSP